MRAHNIPGARALARKRHGRVAVTVARFRLDELVLPPRLAAVAGNGGGQRGANRRLPSTVRLRLALMIVPDDEQVAGGGNACERGRRSGESSSLGYGVFHVSPWSSIH